MKNLRLVIITLTVLTNIQFAALVKADGYGSIQSEPEVEYVNDGGFNFTEEALELERQAWEDFIDVFSVDRAALAMAYEERAQEDLLMSAPSMIRLNIFTTSRDKEGKVIITSDSQQLMISTQY
jgi:alanine racemase